jgi:hypothetical protein
LGTTAKARQQVKDSLATTILEGQFHSWTATQAMIKQYQKRQKVIQRAVELQKPAPVFRRLYSSLGPGKATFRKNGFAKMAALISHRLFAGDHGLCLQDFGLRHLMPLYP